MRKQEQVLSVIALLLLAGVLLYHVLSSPLKYDITVEDEVTTETVVNETTVSFAADEPTTESVTEPGTLSDTQTTTPPAIDATGKVNLNTASLQDLMTLKGIGQSKAQAILDDRNENGPFSSIEDLTRVSGIGEKTFENLRDQITV